MSRFRMRYRSKQRGTAVLLGLITVYSTVLVVSNACVSLNYSCITGQCLMDGRYWLDDL